MPQEDGKRGHGRHCLQVCAGLRVPSRRPGIRTSRRSLPTSGLKGKRQELPHQILKAQGRGHSRRPARQELMGRRETGENIPLGWFFHLLPVVTSNLKPEGKGARVMQPRKFWEDRRMIWKGEWGVPSRPLLASGGPGLWSSPGKSLNRVRDLSFLPSSLSVGPPGFEDVCASPSPVRGEQA